MVTNCTYTSREQDRTATYSEKKIQTEKGGRPVFFRDKIRAPSQTQNLPYIALLFVAVYHQKLCLRKKIDYRGMSPRKKLHAKKRGVAPAMPESPLATC